MTRSSLPYRPGTGVMLLNADDDVFVGRRIDTTQEAWQMPQGGIDKGEGIEESAFRELEEEIGTRNAEVVARTRGWLTYDLPESLIPKVWGGRYRGQRQVWFLMRFLGSDREIDIDTEHPEFRAWKWVPMEKLPKMIVPFKRPLYQRLLKEFSPYLEKI